MYYYNYRLVKFYLSFPYRVSRMIPLLIMTTVPIEMTITYNSVMTLTSILLR
jgi:hypothetical protein